MFRSRPPQFAALGLLGAVWLAVAGCTPSNSSQLDEERESHFLAGKSRVNTLDFQGAIECFEKALEVNPHSAAAHLELGCIYEQREIDPAAAIYHYQRYITLRTNAGNEDTIKRHIMSCKQELARTVSLGPISQGLQRDFEKLLEENKKLQEELQKLKQARAEATPAPVTAVIPAPPAPTTRSTPSISSVAPSGASSTSRQQTLVASTPTSTRITASNSGSSARSYTIKSGDTPSSVAKKYNIRVESLMAANPGLDPRKMRVGQTVNLPVQ